MFSLLHIFPGMCRTSTLVQQFRNFRMLGHGRFCWDLIKRGVRSLPAPWTVATAVRCIFCFLTGAAAGIAEFQGGRAFIPVAFTFFMVLVNFTACAGVFGGARFFGYFRLVLVVFLCSGF